MVGKKVDFTERYGQDPVVLVFARKMTKPLTSLVKRLDAEVAKRKPAKLYAIVVIVSDDDDALERDLQDFAVKVGITSVNLAIMEPAGPKLYKLSKEADVTVLMYKRLKVEANRAFKTSELNEDAVERVLADMPKIISSR